MTALAEHIQATRLSDTHEHLPREPEFLAGGSDALRDLFDNYVTADLVVAGASVEAVARLVDPSDPDLHARFAGVQAAWQRCQHTGYGEAVRLIARRVYNLEEITPEGLEAAQPRAALLHRPGERLRLLRKLAGLDHVQVDDFRWDCPPDPSGPDFFLYDLSWADLCDGRVDAPAIEREEIGRAHV